MNLSYKILLKKQAIPCKLHCAIRLTLRDNLSIFQTILNFYPQREINTLIIIIIIITVVEIQMN